MVPEQKVSDALDTLAGHVEDIGDRITHSHVEGIFETIPNDEIGPIQLRGHRCLSDDNVYYVAAHRDLRSVFIIYHFSLVETIANELTHEVAETVLSAVGIDGQESDPRMATASYLLEDAEQSEMQAFKSHFKIAASGESYLTNITATDSCAFGGYSLERMIFPYEDKFSIREFNDAVTAIVSGGVRSAEIVRQNLALAVDKDEPANTSINFGQ